MASATALLADSALIADGDELVVTLSVPWYRSLPLSSIVGLDLSLDGRRIPADRVVADFGGVRSSIPELDDRWQEYWFVQDRGAFRIPNSPRRTAGERVRVDAELRLRIPYVEIAPGQFFVQRVAESNDLTITEKEDGR